MNRRHPALNREHRIITTQDVMEILGVSTTKAYQIIRKLNAELEEKGVLKESLMGGRVPERYFYERVFMCEPPSRNSQKEPGRPHKTQSTE